jgi:glucose/arabinose dehydrogenase
MKQKRMLFILFITCNCLHLQAQPVQNKNTTFPTKPLQAQHYNIVLENLPTPFESQSVVKPPKNIARPDNAALQVPDGFAVNIYHENLDSARWMALAPNGDIFVVQSRLNRISILRDSNKDGKAEQVFTFAEGKKDGLNQPMGIAFYKDYLYIANTTDVIRIPYKSGQTKKNAPHKPFINDISFGGYNQHWTRNLIRHKDKWYLSIGSETNVEPEPLPRASIQTFSLDGKNQQLYAYGLRNPVGMAIHPQTEVLWATVSERDWLGDDLVPDFFTSIKKDGFYGWPYAYLSAKNPDPRRTGERPDLIERTTIPDLLLQAHSVPLGLVFYKGRQFPEEYKHNAFIALRGSANRSKGTGYKIVRVKFNAEGKPEGGYDDFVTGWLHNEDTPSAWGRPTGLLETPDGSLLIADETGGVIWRVSYKPKAKQ